MDDIQRAAPPPEIQRAIFGTSPASANDEELMPATALQIPNPWIAKKPNDSNDRRLEYVSDDAEERALEGPINQIKKLVAPPVVKSTEPVSLGPMP